VCSLEPLRNRIVFALESGRKTGTSFVLLRLHSDALHCPLVTKEGLAEEERVQLSRFAISYRNKDGIGSGA
jgi:hypothetical protein